MQLDYLMDQFGAVCAHITMPWSLFAHLMPEWEEVVWCILDECHTQDEWWRWRRRSGVSNTSTPTRSSTSTRWSGP